MRSVPKKIFQILDGTPAVYGQYSRGQSLVELALVTPLLIVLLMGLAEIGWFANNYLILLETTRVGARYGAVQTQDQSPKVWPAEGSLIPSLAGAPGTDAFDAAKKYRVCTNLSSLSETYRFYTVVVCRMLDAMSPLDFRGDYSAIDDALNNGNGVDDIVISGFALKSVNPQDPDIPLTMRSSFDWQYTAGANKDQQQVLVVGRYPVNANECTTATGTDADLRDPFNYINYTVAANTDSGWRNFVVPSSLDPNNPNNRLYYEVPGYDTGTERQRGFAFTGQHIISSTRALAANQQCYGSEWNIKRVQDLMNVSNFSLASQAQRSNIPSQGLMLVEMFWQHTLLLRNPVFNPVFNILNDPNNPTGNGTIISVWAAFPLPSVEPRIKYGLGS